MASSRLYVAASSEGHYVDAVAVGNLPITIAGWFKFTDVSNLQTLCMICKASVAEDYYWLVVNNDLIYAIHRDGTGVEAITSAGPSDNTWHHAAATFVSTTERSAFLDGGNKGTNTDAKTEGGPMDRTSIGYAGDSTPDFYANGNLFEIGIWDIELSDAEIAQLAGGADPTTIQAGNLLGLYFNGTESDNDLIGSYHLTAIGTPEWDVGDIPPLRVSTEWTTHTHSTIVFS